MISKIPLSEVENIIMSHLMIDVKLGETTFYMLKLEEKITIYWIKDDSLLKHFQPDIITDSIGIPIMTVEDQQLKLFPPFINIISNQYPSYKLEKELLVSVSYGKQIRLVKPNAYCFILNGLDDKVSFGEIQDNIYLPIIDLGWYLRQGN